MNAYIRKEEKTKIDNHSLALKAGKRKVKSKASWGETINISAEIDENLIGNQYRKATKPKVLKRPAKWVSLLIQAKKKGEDKNCVRNERGMSLQSPWTLKES